MKKHEIPGRVAFEKGDGDLPKIIVTTNDNEAEIYLHGAHVTRFRKDSEPPLLFVSAKSNFAADKPIRGGVPVIFPWFGPREGSAMHGFARTTEWELVKTSEKPDGSVQLHFSLPEISRTRGVWKKACRRRRWISR